jgi:hypothetical protein
MIETTETKMANLELAKTELDAAKAEQRKCHEAKAAAGHQGSRRIQEERYLRDELEKQTMDACLDGDMEAFKDKLAEGSSRLVAIDIEIQVLSLAENRLGLRATGPLQNRIDLCQSEYEYLYDSARIYQKTKKEYEEVYREAVRAESDREQFSTSEHPAFQRFPAIKKHLQDLAQRLGCEDDCQSFIISVEKAE